MNARVLLSLLALAPMLGAAETQDFLKKPPSWFAGDEAKTVAANVLSYQSDYGGWPKNRDLSAAKFEGAPGDLVGELKPIFDNGATADEIRFFARMFGATQDARCRRAVEDGLDYVLIAQYPSGGWPQFYPPDAQYHRHITFNDNTMVRILTLLREIATTPDFAFVDADRRRAAAAAFQRGIECILKCQIKVQDRLAAWCAQHDEIDFRPRAGRSYELASLSGAESGGIVKLLMSVPRPSPALARSIEAAVAWFEAARIEGWRVIEHAEENGAGRNFEAVRDPAAGPLWARFYDLATGQPLWSDRDGQPRLGMENIGWARHGYRWTGDWPESLLAKNYPMWKAKLAKTGLGPEAPAWQPRARIALAGDSTVTDAGGWGFGFKKQLAAEVLCHNFAGGGQSSKSFRDGGAWARTLASKPAFVLIQFGHNDMPGKGPNRETDPATTYAENLTRCVVEAREAGAQPVIVTSLARRIYEPDGKLRGELAPYVDAARKVASEQGAPLIDLYARSIELCEKLGLAGVAPFEPKAPPRPAAVAPDQAEAKPVADVDSPAAVTASRRDGTHLNARGSLEFGRIVVEELQRVLPETAPLFRPSPAQ